MAVNKRDFAACGQPKTFMIMGIILNFVRCNAGCTVQPASSETYSTLGMSREAQNEAAKIHLAASLRMGDWLRNAEKATGCIEQATRLQSATASPESYSSLGIDKTDAFRLQRLYDWATGCGTRRRRRGAGTVEKTACFTSGCKAQPLVALKPSPIGTRFQTSDIPKSAQLRTRLKPSPIGTRFQTSLQL